MKENLKISILWVAVIAGMSAHSLIEMIPLFWNADIAISNEGVAPMPILVMMAIVSFTIPVIGLLLSLYAVKRWHKIVHVCLAFLLALFCAAHCVELITDFELPQLFIHPMLVVLSVTLAYEAWKWNRKI
ncbi:MAG: hypothetical protein SOZ80_05805 [Prevotella sp.]|uniref:hypothetical protein n=1 Tax=Prevotella sp. TaxID=59823 RepID=UPI002A297018|nr:hypothetical protein [Prevotella sp.]MDD7318373.1 hypothetical protein [Prevotellaceae bacterium]MDY4020276.1 hypothetical protein [Prevotella sp.]